jgi:hypothetical protein
MTKSKPIKIAVKYEDAVSAFLRTPPQKKKKRKKKPSER